MNEWEKAQQGYLYDANHNPEVTQMRLDCADLCYELNHTRPSNTKRQQELVNQLFKKTGTTPVITTPFHCDYGKNITVGDYFYTNYHCVILDCAPVTFGDYVFIAPNCVFSTAGHPLDAQQRAAGLEIALPITVGSHVWFGANVTVLPGVTIGDNTIIGAGSVVTKDIPSGVIAVGNPCRVLRALTPEDAKKYPIYPESEER